MKRKQIQRRAKPPMIALLRFFDALEIGVEVFAIGPGGAVDALQLFVARVAAPVGAGDAGQLKCLDGRRCSARADRGRDRPNRPGDKAKPLSSAIPSMISTL